MFYSHLLNLGNFHRKITEIIFFIIFSCGFINAFFEKVSLNILVQAEFCYLSCLPITFLFLIIIQWLKIKSALVWSCASASEVLFIFLEIQRKIDFLQTYVISKLLYIFSYYIIMIYFHLYDVIIMLLRIDLWLHF